MRNTTSLSQCDQPLYKLCTLVGSLKMRKLEINRLSKIWWAKKKFLKLYQNEWTRIIEGKGTVLCTVMK